MITWRGWLGALAALGAAGALGCGSGKCNRPGARQIYQGRVTAIAADEASVYFATETGIWAADAGSATPTQLAPATWVLGMALDGTSVFWTQGGASDQVFAVPKQGGAVRTIGQGTNTPAGLAVDGASAYWWDGSFIRVAQEQGGVPADAGASTALSISGPGAFLDPAPNALLPVGNQLWWLDWESRTLLVTPKDGGTASAPISGHYGVNPTDPSVNPRALAVLNGTAYWVNDSTSQGVGEALALAPGSSTPTVLASSVPVGDGIAATPTRLYWSGTTSLQSLSLDGGTANALLSNLLFVGQLATGSGQLYFIDGAYMNDACSGLFATPLSP